MNTLAGSQVGAGTRKDTASFQCESPMVSPWGSGGVFPLDPEPPDTGKGFDGLMLGLASDSHVLKQLYGWLSHVASAANFNWTDLSFPAMLFGTACQLSVLKGLLFVGLFHCIFQGYRKLDNVNSTKWGGPMA